LQQAGIAELGPFILAYRNWKLRVYRAVWNIVQQTWTAERYIRGRHQWHLPFIEKLQDSGHLPRVDPISIVLMVTAACQMPFLLAPEILAATGKNFLTQAAIKDHADAVTKIFLRQPD
jgi:hypothetical protein